MNFPVFSQLAGNFRVSETGSLQTASSSGESTNVRFLSRRRRSLFEAASKSPATWASLQSQVLETEVQSGARYTMYRPGASRAAFLSSRYSNLL